MFRIALFSRDPALRKTVAAALQQGDCEVKCPEGRELLLEFACRTQADCLILDLNALRSDWQAECHALRRARELRPFALISIFPDGRFADLAAEADIDDFLVQPFSAGELRARVSRLRRARGSGRKGHLIEQGNVVLDQEKYEVRVHGRPVLLTYQEYALLCFLMTHPDQVFTRNALLNNVWGYDYFGGTRTVDVHVQRLRAKLGPAGARIETVWGVGYRFSSSAQSDRE